MNIVELLKAERDKAAQQVDSLDSAIKALSGLSSAGGSARGHRTMSAAARARISTSQRARWARTRGGPGFSRRLHSSSQISSSSLLH